MEILVVDGFEAGVRPALIDRLVAGLEAGGHGVMVSSLAVEGFDRFMSADERAAYHGDQPLITPEAMAGASAVRAATGLVVCYPVIHGTCPPRVKSWQERVFVLGVGFEFAPSGRITGALTHLRRACVVGVEAPEAGPIGRGRNDNGRCLARSFFLSSNRRCRARYLPVVGSADDDDPLDGERSVSGWLQRW